MASSNTTTCSQITINRPLYQHGQLRSEFNYRTQTPSSKKYINQVKEILTDGGGILRTIGGLIPIFVWLPQYKWKQHFSSDLIAGFTVAVMHIPQGMAYALLGNVPPIVGIYMAFFPVLIYFLFGTSRHNSMGTFAIVCLVTGKAVLEHSHSIHMADDKSLYSNNATFVSEENPRTYLYEHSYTPIEVATAVTITVAIFQIFMFIFRLGMISVLLSDPLVSGFITGAAFQVMSSQLKDLLGLQIARQKGMFVVEKTLMSIFESIDNVNPTAVLLSIITICLMTINGELIKPYLARKCQFPIPIELLVIVGGTLLSRYMQFGDQHIVAVVGSIPKGLPTLTLPPLELIPKIVKEGFLIAVVSYTVSYSMAFRFAQKQNYEIDANQELLAQGLGNAFGSLFSCMPFTASLSRSALQESVGGKTQIASLVSCTILVFVLLWIGPFFEPLPKCILSSIIVVALKGMLMQVLDLLRFWKLNKFDGITWIATFAGVAFISIDIGLAIGVSLSLITVILTNFKPYVCTLGWIPNTDIYLDTAKYEKSVPINGVQIFHYAGSLTFATRTLFRDELIKHINVNPQKEVIIRRKVASYMKKKELHGGLSEKQLYKLDHVQSKLNNWLKCIIVDFTAISYLDPSGAFMLQQIADNFSKIDVFIYIAGCSEPIYNLLLKCQVISKEKGCIQTFATLHDAVKYATELHSVQENDISVISRL